MTFEQTLEHAKLTELAERVGKKKRLTKEQRAALVGIITDRADAITASATMLTGSTNTLTASLVRFREQLQFAMGQ